MRCTRMCCVSCVVPQPKKGFGSTMSAIALSILRTLDDTFARASLSKIQRAIDTWASAQCDEGWLLKVRVAVGTYGDSLLVSINGFHPLVLGENLGIEIDTVHGMDKHGEPGSRLTTYIVGVPGDGDALGVEGRTDVYDITRIAQIDRNNLAPSVVAREQALVRAWAACM